MKLRTSVCTTGEEQGKNSPMLQEFQQFKGNFGLCGKPKKLATTGEYLLPLQSKNTIKFLVGISVNDAISYISEGFEGSISDKAIFSESGICSYLNEGVDRGFTISEEYNSHKILLFIPPFLDKRDKPLQYCKLPRIPLPGWVSESLLQIFWQ